MSLALRTATGFCAPIRQTDTPKPIGGLISCNAAGGRSMNGYFLPSISMAKTRATVRQLADQLHIIRPHTYQRESS